MTLFLALLLALLLAVGNLLSTTTPAGTTNLTYDLADRITTAGYASDDASALVADPERTYAYDGFGRLAAVTLDAVTTAYTLDGAGRRTAETTNAVTTSFDLDLSVPNATILGDGTRTYLPGDPSAGYAQAGVWHSALADQLGSPHSLVSQAGVQSAATRWDPFGGPRPGSTVSPGIGYAGEWRDPTGLIDLRARAYDPSLGRFVSRDGFGGLLPVPQTANRYSYALNGPYRYTDPSGRFVNAVSANAPLLTSLAIPIAGISLSSEERAIALGGAAILGGGFHLLSRLGDGVADASRLGRTGEGLGEGARGANRSGDSVATYRASLPSWSTPSTTSAGRYEIRTAGPTNYRMTAGNVHIDADGIDDATAAVLEAKHVGDPGRSPFIPGSAAPSFVREAVDAQIRDELRRYLAIVVDDDNPITHLRFITNHEDAVPYFEGLLKELQVPGHVELRY